jgi:hypothetical protein
MPSTLSHLQLRPGYNCFIFSLFICKKTLKTILFANERKKITLSTYLDQLRTDGRYWLSRKEAIEALQINDKAFKLSAHRLSIKGSLKRVRGDFFIIVPPEHRAIGALPAIWFKFPVYSRQKRKLKIEP